MYTIYEGLLVMSNIQMEKEVSHAPLYCFACALLATLVLKETSLLQPHLPTQLVHLTFFIPSWRVHLDLQTLCMPFLLHWLFCFHFLSNTTLIPSKAPD